jgi:hypothetical protein
MLNLKPDTNIFHHVTLSFTEFGVKMMRFYTFVFFFGVFIIFVNHVKKCFIDLWKLLVSVKPLFHIV